MTAPYDLYSPSPPYLAPLGKCRHKSYPAGDFTGIDARGVIDVVFETGPIAFDQCGRQEDRRFYSDIYIGSQSGDTLEIGRTSLREGFRLSHAMYRSKRTQWPLKVRSR